MTTTDKLPPVHPGEILMEDFLKGMGITQHKLAVSIGVPPRRINEIVHGKRAVTADTALRLAKFFEMSPSSGSGYRLNMTWRWRQTRPSRKSSGFNRSKLSQRSGYPNQVRQREDMHADGSN